MFKEKLRLEINAQRQALAPELSKHLSDVACAAVVAAPAFAVARIVLLYWAFRGEVSTVPLAEAARVAGKRLALPRVRRRPKGLDLHLWSGDPAALVAGSYGIAEPDPAWPLADPSQIDLVVVPGVAFDRRGARLGYGGGYYDRTLPLVKAANKNGVAVGLCYGFQLVERLEVEPHDQFVDAVATEHGLLWTPAGG